MSNKVYLADKETLDSVNEKIGKVSETAGVSLFGKINLCANDAHSANIYAQQAHGVAGSAYTSADLAKGFAKTAAEGAIRLEAAIGDSNDPAAAYGSVHGKLSSIISVLAQLYGGYSTASVDVDRPEQMVLVTGDSRNEITVTPNNGEWCEGAINIEEPGLVHAVYINNPLDFTKNVRLIIDGRTYELGKTQNSSMNYIAQFMDGTIGYTSSPSGGIPIRFKDGFRVDVETNGAGNTMPTLRMAYETYKTISGGV